MSKARNMIIDGYKSGTQLKIDNIGMYYSFNGREPLEKQDFESYQILSQETSKDTVSTIGRGLVGSALFGMAGTTAALTGKENKIYTILVTWNKYAYPKATPSILELDEEFYRVFMLKCARTEADQKEYEEINRILHPEDFPDTNKPIKKKEIIPEPPKYIYDYEKWLKINDIEDDGGVNQTYLTALDNKPDINPELDCCRSVNPEWEAYIQQRDNPVQNDEDEKDSAIENRNADAFTDIKSKLKELKSLFDEDLITEEEYTAKKQELLKQL